MDTDDKQPDISSETQMIQASGQTDDIRYVLHPEPGGLDKQYGRSDVAAEDLRRHEIDAPLASDSSGLGDISVDDADSQLPDHGTSTIRGGQVATESKRGAY